MGNGTPPGGTSGQPPAGGYEALEQAAAAHAHQAGAAPPPVAPRSRAPLLAGLLVVWAGALVYAVPRLLEPVPPPPPEVLALGAAVHLDQAADLLEELARGQAGLPGTAPSIEAFAGLEYERLGPKAFALSARVGGEALRLESRDGQRTLGGPGAARLSGAPGGGR